MHDPGFSPVSRHGVHAESLQAQWPYVRAMVHGRQSFIFAVDTHAQRPVALANILHLFPPLLKLFGATLAEL